MNVQDSDDEEFHGSHGIRRRQPQQKIEPGSMNVLSAKYEVSLRLEYHFTVFYILCFFVLSKLNNL